MSRSAHFVVPWFTADIDPTLGGASAAAIQLDSFAGGYGVSPDVRRRLAAITIRVVTALGDARPRVTLEADIDQGSLQVVLTQERDSGVSAKAALARLATLAHDGEGFAARRDGGSVEVWICLRLGWPPR
jgi:hypothetical protein